MTSKHYLFLLSNNLVYPNPGHGGYGITMPVTDQIEKRGRLIIFSWRRKLVRLFKILLSH
eukprot:c40084_g1_i1 orf=35-214(+)